MITIEKRRNSKGELKIFVYDSEIPDSGARWPTGYKQEHYIADCNCREGCPGRPGIKNIPIYAEGNGKGAIISTFTLEQAVGLHKALGENIEQ